MAEVVIALAGNPNSGKSTLFNDLTGASQYVGNWPGVTVEKKEGRLKGQKDVVITDLPGIYSLSPYTLEEVVSRDYLLGSKVDGILNIVDASNIERNLYLTTQLMEMGIPVVVALNMMDIVRKRGDVIDTVSLSTMLGCPVVEMSAVSGERTAEAAAAAVRHAQQKQAAKTVTFSSEVEAVIQELECLLAGCVPKERLRWTAVKVFERDKDLHKAVRIPAELLAKAKEITAAAEEAMDDDSESIITNERYEYIAEVIQKAVKKKATGMTLSDKIDRVVTNRWLALPIFVAIMFLVYYISVTSLGTIVTDFTNDTLFGEWVQPAVQETLEGWGTEDWMISLIVDGIIGGLAAPIGFAPQMAILFLFLSFLEDCGYMARVAFIMDRIFHRFGLSGKSFIPLLISSGCGVPGIMASRTIENERDRRMTIMTTTFIPCGAKLPVIALISGAIMGGEWWMAPAMYFVGIVSVIVSAIILKKTSVFAGDPAPFVMELPQYHMPTMRNVLLHVWERVWSFLKKAGTILFLCCIVMWFLATFGFEDGGFVMVEDIENCLMATIGNAMAPIFAPLGFGTWQAVASAISGFAAKEAIVSTMAVLSGMAEAAEDDAGLWQAGMVMFPSAVAAFAFLIFNLLDSPCLAAISTISKEMNSSRWTWITILYQNVFAYAVTLMVYQFGVLFFEGGTVTAGTAAAVIVLAVFLYLLFRPAPKAKKDEDDSVLAVRA